ncbi:MAG: 30S ribosomal protein S4 [Candidatus Sungbacteria bacterium]|nr:30S ribosomal protein S4 [Candidatus Sungbacteria bacterium]
MPKVLEKVERRLGEKLFLKGDRCAGPKCAAVRHPSPPGIHGKTRRRAPSEFGQYLQGKQKVRFLYGLDDRDLNRYAKKAESMRGAFAAKFLQLLERRLDNVVFRLGFTGSRRSARQAVSHGHIRVNGRRVSVPSYQVKIGEVVSINPGARQSSHFADLEHRLKKYTPPVWLALEKDQVAGKVVGSAESDMSGTSGELIKIKEFYSR